VVSPNVLEAEELVGHEFNDDEDRAIAVREMVQLGAHEAVMTDAGGCVAQVIVDGAPRLFRVVVEPRPVRSTVGSGDAFLAGYVAARYSGSTPEECLRFAVACGAESTEHFGAGTLDPNRVERVMAEVSLEPQELSAEVS
jgi:1-phosphofructokinase/tagatose 6-phosphate kinase